MNNDELRRFTVRVKSKNGEGSGFVIYPKSEQPEVYVFTAKHCLLGNDYKDSIAVDEISIELDPIMLADDIISSVHPVKIIHSKTCDFSILICDKTTVNDIIDLSQSQDIVFIKQLSHLDRESPFSFRGFPNAIEVDHLFEARYKDKGNDYFEIETTISLDSFYDSAENNISGLSGSAVFMNLRGSHSFVGILYEIKGFQTLKCCFVYPEIDKLLVENGYPRLFAKPARGIENKSTQQVASQDKSIPNDHPFHNFDDTDINRLRNSLFPSMYNGETVLLIGPGAVIDDEKPFLDDRIISNYQSNNSHEEFEYKNILDYLETLATQDEFPFSRREFDNNVVKYLNRLETPQYYDIIPLIRWRSIISTVPDKMLEPTYVSSSNSKQNLSISSSVNEIKADYLATELQYIKVNGNSSNIDQYRLFLSESDFKGKNKTKERTVKELKNLSPNRPILCIGFSQNDSFAKFLLEQMNVSRMVYNVDSHISGIKINSLHNNGISTIKAKPSQFFEEYRKWIDEGLGTKNRKKNYNFKNKKDISVGLNQTDIYSLGNAIKQVIVENSYGMNMKQYYLGKEPTYNVIANEYDVIKKQQLASIKDKVLSEFQTNKNRVPTIMLTGSYGTGKTTFAYRLIHEIVIDESLDFIAYDVLDPDKIKIKTLVKLLEKADCTHYIFHFDSIEKDSAFKKMFKFQRELKSEYLSEVKVAIVATIRENILEKNNHLAYDFNKISIDQPFNEIESEELVEKLIKSDLLIARDAMQKQKLIDRINKDYDGDTLVTMYNLIEESKHDSFVERAYDELTDETQKAFMYTSLLYRYKIQMPANLLKDILQIDWDEFKNRIMKVDGKDILIQVEPKHTTSLEPDLYFVTRHSTISDILVKKRMRNRNSRFKMYKNIVSNLTSNSYHSKMVVDLLKALKQDEQENANVNKLFDIAHKIFDQNDHFIIQYCINLESRNRDRNNHLSSPEDLLKAYEILKYYYSEEERGVMSRNSRITHRRGVICFKLAKYYLTENHRYEADLYANEAREFFDIKKSIDPHSSFSYLDYIRLEIWSLDRLVSTDEDKMEKKVLIEELFDDAKQNVRERVDRIEEERIKYYTNHKIKHNQHYEDNLWEEIRSEKTETPYPMILLYYYYESKEEEDGQQSELVQGLEQFSDYDNVVKLLFKHYGKNLHEADIRVKFYDIIRDNEYLIEKEALRYYYLSYVANCYDQHFDESYTFLENLRKNFKVSQLNENNILSWNENSNDKVFFEGVIVRYKGRKWVQIKSPIYHRIQFFTKEKLSVNTSVKVHVYFTYKGMVADIIEIKPTD
jgi:hypothetical protein